MSIPIKKSDALFLDIDGTILDIANNPQEVIVTQQLIADLSVLQNKLSGALAFVSGRMIGEIDDLFKPLRLRCVGSHGAEWRLTPNGNIETGQPLPSELRDSIAVAFSGTEDVFVEDKIYSVAVHYRNIPQEERAIEKELLSAIECCKSTIVFIRGRKVFEISSAHHNKGSAIERLMLSPPFKNRSPIFIGDDTTDVPAVETCSKLGGTAACVGNRIKCKNYFASPAEVRSWIHEAAEKL